MNDHAIGGGNYRAAARAAVTETLIGLGPRRLSGRELAAAVEAACPWADRPRRRAWQAARRQLVGRLRHRDGRAREWVGVMAFGDGD